MYQQEGRIGRNLLGIFYRADRPQPIHIGQRAWILAVGRLFLEPPKLQALSYSLVVVSPLPLSSTQPQGPKMQLHFWQRHPLPWTNPPIHPIYCHHFRCSVDCGICSLPPTHFHLCLHPLKMFVGSSEIVAGVEGGGWWHAPGCWRLHFEKVSEEEDSSMFYSGRW